jgi:signal transduction histidine kinase
VTRRRYGLFAIGLGATAAGIATLAVARRAPAGSLAGASTFGAIAELAAGWSLVAAGLFFWDRHPRNRLGPLLAGGGFAWLAPEWSNAWVGSAFVFTLGLAAFAACAPLVVHAALAYPTGRLRSHLERGAVTASYVGAAVALGLLPASVFDPRATGCFECPRNLLLVHGDGDLFDAFNRYGLRLGLAWLAASGTLLAWRAVRSPIARPVVAPALAYVVLTAWDFEHSLARGILSNDSFDQRVWRLEAAALTALALGVAWGLLRERRARAAVARLVVELARMPKPGAVRDALAASLGDATLEVAYRRPGGDAYVDAAGRAVDVSAGSGRSVTPLLSRETPVAALVHEPRLLERPGLVQEVLSAARIAIENERLQAEVRAQLEDLRASRARIVDAADAERRRLERDLHDGAQQRLLALCYDLHVARATAARQGDPRLTSILDAAGERAQTALAQLRELAHGIYPAVLAEAGLASALETLADEAPLPVELGQLPAERYPGPVEAAAYLTVARAIEDAAGRGATFVAAAAAPESGRLVVDAADDGAPRTAELIDLADRVGAIGGTLTAEPNRLRAEIPCR